MFGDLVTAALFALIRSPGHVHAVATNIINTIVSSILVLIRSLVHSTLLHKMKHYGIDGLSLKLIESLITNVLK